MKNSKNELNLDQRVKVWKEDVIIPTYEIGAPEKNPIFLEKRVYQGSSGAVYPYPVVEKIADEKVDKVYHAIYIENEYIKVMILPELGGRVQMAYDKIKQRHFIYYNQVIKPALVGLTGPWISGGIEFNWPQHHRPSTFLPVDHTIEYNEDGSVTVWVSEMEKMFHQKGMAGFTLRPGKAALEIKGKLYNRTPFPQTFLWWANPAVAVNDFYQSVFPPDVNAVLTTVKGMSPLSRSLPVLIIKLTIRKGWISLITRISLYRLRTWPSTRSTTLWVVMRTIQRQGYCTWPTTMCHRGKSSGLGEMVILERHGIETLPTRMAPILN